MTSSGGRTISNTRSATGLPVRPPMSGSRRRRPPARLALAAAIVAFVGALAVAPIALADTTPPSVNAPVISPNPVASGVTVTPTSGLTTTEAGGTATFTVVLTARPTADVAIGLSSNDTTEGTASASSLTQARRSTDVSRRSSRPPATPRASTTRFRWWPCEAVATAFPRRARRGDSGRGYPAALVSPPQAV